MYNPHNPPVSSPVIVRSGSSALTSILVSIFTTALMFFCLKYLDQRGIFPTFGASRETPPADVPSLVGMSVEQARDVLKSQHLLLVLDSERDDPKAPAGTIASQTPLPGSRVPTGTPLKAIVSRGPGLVNIPNLSGETAESAARLLGSLGLQLGKERNEASDSVAASKIISSEPRAGTAVQPRSLVELVVSSGPASKAVPKVVGFLFPKAKKTLEDAGFSVGAIRYVADENQFSSAVLRQDPADGAKAAAGSAIQLVVNRPYGY